MVKFTTICREGADFRKETAFDIEKVHRNPDPNLHPLQRAREYQRALVSTKIEKIFAQPFLGALKGHSDSISVISTCPENLQKLVSGSFDGELKVWDIPSRKALVNINAHQLLIKGVCFSPDGLKILSSSQDKTINLYDFQTLLSQAKNEFQDPLVRYMSSSTLGSVDHSYQDAQFASCGQLIQIWNYERSKPLIKFDWGLDTVLNVKYCPSDSNIIAGTTMDRGLVLYDIRAESPIYKVCLMNKSPALAWNPIEPINITIGSDDSNCYTFDIRKMEQAKTIHKDHIQAILSIAFSPSGQEFVSGSFDKTVRIFPVNSGRSREVYHAQRMAQVNSVAFSADGQTVFSGSNDMNIRIWKAEASKKLGHLNVREQIATQYRSGLQQRFGHNKEIKKIRKHRHLPKYLLNANQKRTIQQQQKLRKQKNMEINNKNEFVKPQPEKRAKIQSLQE